MAMAVSGNRGRSQTSMRSRQISNNLQYAKRNTIGQEVFSAVKGIGSGNYAIGIQDYS